MFIEKLKDQETLDIMKKLLAVHYNNAFAQFIINESRLIRDNSVAYLKFPCLDLHNGPRQDSNVGRTENKCIISDYTARVYTSGDQAVYRNEVNTLLRTAMYNKFGNEYLTTLEAFLIDSANTKYHKELNNIDTELYNIQAGRLPMDYEFLEP